MKKFFIKNEQIQENSIWLDGDEFFHLKTVLRTKEGESVLCLDGTEIEYKCEVIKIEKNKALLKVIEQNVCTKNPKFKIDIFQGLPKGEKLELIIQKISELGATALVPFESDFTIAKNNISKMDRLNKIALETCKQCGRSIPLNICKVQKFAEILSQIKDYDLVLFLYEHQQGGLICEYETEIKNANSIAIIVGAEGGFSEKEVDLFLSNNVLCVSLGDRILRTETAAIGLTAFVSFLKNN